MGLSENWRPPNLGCTPFLARPISIFRHSHCMEYDEAILELQTLFHTMTISYNLETVHVQS